MNPIVKQICKIAKVCYKRNSKYQWIADDELRERDETCPEGNGWEKTRGGWRKGKQYLVRDNCKVGKRIGKCGVYVHIDAIKNGKSNLTEKELKLLEEAKKYIGNFVYDFVNINDEKIRFLKMSSLEEAHPHVVKSKIYNISKKVISDGKTAGQIYHRLNTMVNPDDKTYDFHCAVTEFEEEYDLIGKDAPTSKIGYKNGWEEWIESKIKLSEYNDHIQFLQEKYLLAENGENELKNISKIGSFSNDRDNIEQKLDNIIFDYVNHTWNYVGDRFGVEPWQVTKKQFENSAIDCFSTACKIKKAVEDDGIVFNDDFILGNDFVPGDLVETLLPIDILSNNQIHRIKTSANPQKVTEYLYEYVDDPIYVIVENDELVVKYGINRIMAAIVRGDTHIPVLIVPESHKFFILYALNENIRIQLDILADYKNLQHLTDIEKAGDELIKLASLIISKDTEEVALDPDVKGLFFRYHNLQDVNKGLYSPETDIETKKKLKKLRDYYMHKEQVDKKPANLDQDKKEKIEDELWEKIKNKMINEQDKNKEESSVPKHNTEVMRPVGYDKIPGDYDVNEIDESLENIPKDNKENLEERSRLLKERYNKTKQRYKRTNIVEKALDFPKNFFGDVEYGFSKDDVDANLLEKINDLNESIESSFSKFDVGISKLKLSNDDSESDYDSENNTMNINLNRVEKTQNPTITKLSVLQKMLKKMSRDEMLKFSQLNNIPLEKRFPKMNVDDKTQQLEQIPLSPTETSIHEATDSDIHDSILDYGEETIKGGGKFIGFPRVFTKKDELKQQIETMNFGGQDQTLSSALKINLNKDINKYCERDSVIDKYGEEDSMYYARMMNCLLGKSLLHKGIMNQSSQYKSPHNAWSKALQNHHTTLKDELQLSANSVLKRFQGKGNSESFAEMFALYMTNDSDYDKLPMHLQMAFEEMFDKCVEVDSDNRKQARIMIAAMLIMARSGYDNKLKDEYRDFVLWSKEMYRAPKRRTFKKIDEAVKYIAHLSDKDFDDHKFWIEQGSSTVVDEHELMKKVEKIRKRKR